MHWRYTTNNIKIGPIDGVAAVPFVIWLLSPYKGAALSIPVFISILAISVISVMANKKGMSSTTMIRRWITQMGASLSGGRKNWYRFYESKRNFFNV